VLLPLVVLLAGCGSKQNALSPESHPAREISTLWWNMMIGCWLGFGVIVALLVAAYIRRGRAGIPFVRDADKGGTIVVLVLGIATPIVVIATLFFIADIAIIGDTQAPAAATTKMTIHVTGHQFFWAVRYPGTKAVTANEIHIPVRTPINLEVGTADVIHSFWVPQLNRKIDTLPGQINRILLYADKPGRYRGDCAEFCGLQHAHMGMYVFAEPRAQFDAWLAREAKPAPKPSTPAARRGLAYFLSGPCSSCHTIRGTSAAGFTGPDLTHIASRLSLGAVTIHNDPTHLAEWIVDSQHFKPGNQMPELSIPRSQLSDLVAYLETLK
jgi:cytochrome c oxidase subunit II